MKRKIVTAHKTNSCYPEIQIGVEYIVLREDFYNGEGHYLLQAPDGSKFEAPDMLLDDGDE